MNDLVYKVPTSQGNISVWDTQGEGNPVVFIHGNSTCKEVFSKQFIPKLTQKYRLIALDLPGHGDSDKANDAEATYNFSGYADVVIEVINKLGLVNPVVVGWFLGGHIGLDMLQKSQKLAGLLISGTPPIRVSFEGFKEGFLPHPIFESLFTQIEFSKEDAAKFVFAGGIDPKDASFLIDAALKQMVMPGRSYFSHLERALGAIKEQLLKKIVLLYVLCKEKMTWELTRAILRQLNSKISLVIVYILSSRLAMPFSGINRKSLILS